jgi:tRNA-Thr(GGU) m(6)t(6)A37 methyltransferase TsaA
MKPIAYLKCHYKEKFGTPRQSNSVPEAFGEIEFLEPYNRPEFFDGLEEVSHIWVIGEFDQAEFQGPKVRPPRLGGNKKVGVFATRSPFRPNPISLSLFKIIELNFEKGASIKVSGIDLMNDTPIYDIKPFHHEADVPKNFSSGWIENLETKSFDLVEWTSEAKEWLIKNVREEYSEIRLMIEKTVLQDPRPAYKSEEKKNKFHFKFSTFDVQFQVIENKALITSIKRASV